MRMLIEVGYTGNRANHLGVSNAWDSLPIQYLSRLAGPRYRDHQCPRRQCGESVLRDPAVCHHRSGDSHHAGLAAAAAVPAVHRRDLHGRLRLLLVSRAVGARGEALLARLHGAGELHVVEVHGGDQPPERRAKARWNTSSPPYDRPQQFSPNGIYELPFGKGRHFLAIAARMGRPRRRRLAGAGHLRGPDRLADGFRQHSVHGQSARYRAAEVGADHQSLLQYRAPASTPIRRSSSPATIAPSRRC